MDSLPGLERPGALDSLAASRTLDSLDIGIQLHGESLDTALPRLPLEYLRFTRNALRFTGLRGLRRMATVKKLSLASLPRKLTPEDFEEIAAMPALEELRLNWNATGWEAGPVLPPHHPAASEQVRGERVNKFTGNEDISKLCTLFPEVRSVSVLLAPEVLDVPDRVLGLLPGQPVVERNESVL